MFPTRKFSGELTSSQSKASLGQLDFAGIVMWLECQLKDCQRAHWIGIITSKYGKRSRGRPRKNWRSCVLEDAANFTGVNNIDVGIVQYLAADRVRWRHMLRRQRDVCDAGQFND